MTIGTTFEQVIRHVDGKSASGGTWILAISCPGSEVLSKLEVRLGELVRKCVKVVKSEWSGLRDVPIESDIKCLWRCRI